MAEFADKKEPRQSIDWEAFYGNYRKPGYVPGYEIINKLGGGVFGLVFKARKESIGKDYAIKFLKVDDEVVRDAVARELETVRFFAQIDHPNLVSIEDKGEVDGIPYIIMSYAGEGTLRKRLEAGPMDREEALRTFIQAARGIQALHEHSLVHFDLKPANIFLRGDIARVGDYGLSKLVTESRNSLSFGRGTPYYMAPEMLQRRGDGRSDIYSLGIILYECLTGDVPFKGDSEWEVLRKHETERPVFPHTITAREEEVLERCLEKKPEDRFQTVEALLRALQAPASLGESMFIPPAVPLQGGGSAVASAAGTASNGSGGTQAAAAATAVAYAPPPPPSGLIGGLIHLIFRVFEMMILVILAPVRIISLAFGHGLMAVFQFPVRVLGITFSVAGYLFVLLLFIAVVVAFFSLVASA
ncbi:MAG: serine/threonine-protein kinase [Planctomycetota bacterium]